MPSSSHNALSIQKKFTHGSYSKNTMHMIKNNVRRRTFGNIVIKEDDTKDSPSPPSEVLNNDNGSDTGTNQSPEITSDTRYGDNNYFEMSPNPVPIKGVEIYQ